MRRHQAARFDLQVIVLASIPLLPQILSSGCAPDIDIGPPPPSPTERVTAQFDPTNPIPVLQIIPTPTGLAQRVNPDGSLGDLDPDAVFPEDCELPTVAQCLPFTGLVGGWPVNVPPTLVFEDDLDPSTVEPGGIIFLEVDASGAATPVPFTLVQAPLAEPPVACQDQFGFDQAASSAFGSNTEVTLVPDTPGNVLQPNTTYIVAATKALRAVGLDGGPPREVESSDLFFSLVQNDPVGAGFEDFTPITVDTDTGVFSVSGLLSASVEEAVQAQVDAGLIPDTPEAREAAAQASLEALFGLQTFLRSIAANLVAGGVVSNVNDLVFANSWTTGASAPTASFDPLAEEPVIPFPNVPLLTEPDGDDVQNAFPVEGSELEQLIFASLNTLNGFSAVAPIVIPMGAPVDPTTLPGNVLLVPYDNTVDPAVPTGEAPPLFVAAAVEDQIIIEPLEPLSEDTFYAIGVVGGPDGVLSTDGEQFIQETLFTFLNAEDPLVSGTSTTAEILDTFVAAGVQCGFLLENGTFPPDEFTLANLQAIEFDLDRAEFQDAFEAFESMEPPMPRSSFSIAFPFKTQTLTATVALAKTLIQDDENGYPSLPDPSGLDEVVDVEGFVFPGQLAKDFICSQVCSSGFFALPVGGSPSIPPESCPDFPDDFLEPTPPAAVEDLRAHNLCPLVSSNVNQVRLVDYRLYDLTTEDPFVFTSGSIQNPAVRRATAWVVSSGATPGNGAPAEGLPTAIFQHGLGQDNGVGFFVVNSLAGANAEGGWASVLLNLPLHGDPNLPGTRASDLAVNATGAVNPLINPDDVVCMLDGTCTGGADGLSDSLDTTGDGFADAAGAGFIGLNLLGTRDNFRQAIVDHLVVFDHLANDFFDLGEGTAAPIDLDGTRIAFLGHSLGSLTGGNTLAFGDQLTAATLHAPGGSLVDVLFGTEESVNGDLLQALVAAGICELNTPGDLSSGCMQTPTLTQFQILGQTLLDPGDPLALSQGVGSQAGIGFDQVLLQVADPDTFVPTATAENLAIAYGLLDPSTGMSSQQVQFTDLSEAPGAMPPLGCHQFILFPINVFGAFPGNLCAPMPDPENPLNTLSNAVCNTFGSQMQAAQWFEDGTILDVAALESVGPIACP
ncbi:MAG: hypothetical protein ACFB9M_07525 [Myxococcota bacterium]